jgi:hypothetical protein
LRQWNMEQDTQFMVHSPVWEPVARPSSQSIMRRQMAVSAVLCFQVLICTGTVLHGIGFQGSSLQCSFHSPAVGRLQGFRFRDTASQLEVGTITSDTRPDWAPFFLCNVLYVLTLTLHILRGTVITNHDPASLGCCTHIVFHNSFPASGSSSDLGGHALEERPIN